MANILTRFADIMSANVNAMLDKLEDPTKMCDQYIRDMTEDLAEVKRETANVMAEEKRAKRLYEDNLAEIEKYLELAKKALTAGNDEDAKVFIAKKQELETLSEG
ncbi:MAG: PspA/IM30 family protein, partial [Bacteroidaceae bacterium]|nr:PspA/IM30 family protein [Bacteroidaceae bacterium]